MSLLNKILFEKQYGLIVNAQNINKVSKFLLWKTFRHEDPQLVDIYLHNVIDKWLINNPVLTHFGFRKFKRLLKKSHLYLDDRERHNLFLLEQQIFSRDRHIKLIDVNFKLNPREKVGIKFLKAQIFMLKKEQLILLRKSTLLVSNQRIIFDSPRTSFFWLKDINHISFEHYGFKFTTGRKTYVLRIHDQTTLNFTLANFFNKKAKYLLKK